MRWPLLFPGLVLGNALAPAAWATVPDTYGHGARWMGAGGGGVAMIEDAFSARLNPAGLGRMRQPNTSVGISHATARLTELPPLVGQTETSAFLDTDRTMYTLGAGVEFWDPLDLVDAPVRFDLFAPVHALASSSLVRSSSEPIPGYPAGTDEIPMGGHLLAFGAEWSFDY